MGGLGGLPFVGKTGFKAFTHHVPKDGHIFILFAPHVGIAKDGLIGKYSRPGQEHLDSACGAAIGAYNTLNKSAYKRSNTIEHQFNNEAIKNSLEPYDEQFSYIVNALKPKFE